jgi:hypothetical protein
MIASAAGLVLVRVPGNARLLSLSLMWSSAAASFVATPSSWEFPADQILWALVIATAAVAYFPEGVATKLALIVCASSGLICGATVKTAGAPLDLLILAAAATVILVPASRWPLVDWGVKVVCSWLIAVAALAATLPLITTPGYQRDHMD